jgi:uncharacterized membrane protein (UPF0127 family)
MRILAHFWRAVRAARWALLLLLLGTVSACSAGDDHLVFHTAKGDFGFTIEIADTEASRERGLMYRTTLAPDAGMLFDFHAEGVRNFWMQNTLIPLDMIFVAEDGTVKTIHVNARPMDTTAISSNVPVRFVLEIAGGRADEIGLKPGDRMEQARVGSPMTQ